MGRWIAKECGLGIKTFESPMICTQHHPAIYALQSSPHPWFDLHKASAAEVVMFAHGGEENGAPVRSSTRSKVHYKQNLRASLRVSKERSDSPGHLPSGSVPRRPRAASPRGCDPERPIATLRSGLRFVGSHSRPTVYDFHRRVTPNQLRILPFF